jgi:hypothetical protein
VSASGPPTERPGTVARLGEERADELRTLHDRLLTGPIEAHGGLLKSTGDGPGAAFGSASGHQFGRGFLDLKGLPEPMPTCEVVWSSPASWKRSASGKVGDTDDLATVALRVTSIFRPEDGSWKIVHRHADPITTPQSPESVIQRQVSDGAAVPSLSSPGRGDVQAPQFRIRRPGWGTSGVAGAVRDIRFLAAAGGGGSSSV